MDMDQSRGITLDAADPILTMEGIHVHFGGITALHDEGFSVSSGEIIGLLGHNGAGKSTLVNVATGAVRPQRGSMKVAGRGTVPLGDPREIERAGIKVIHQEPALAETLSVADNISLGRSEEWLSPGRRREYARKALNLLGSAMNVDRPVSSLEFGEKQIVDLARALSTDLKVLFLDEPTGALGQHETDRLHALLRNLAGQGRGIVYVSHRLRDILEVCTRLVVLRGGKVVLNQSAHTFTVAELSEALAPGSRKREEIAAHKTGEVALRVQQHGQELQFHRGETVGLFGMAAGPQFTLLERLFGFGEPVPATLGGAAFKPAEPRDAIRHGVYYVSANREREGLVKSMSALDNLVLPWLERHKKGLAYSHTKAAAVFQRAKESLNIRGGHMDGPVSALSGGNRQKVVLGRWIFGDRPNVLLLSQPTQGVDVGARLDIANALRNLTRSGVTVLVASSEADEIELLCDRAYTCFGEYWPESNASFGWAENLLKSLVERVSVTSETTG
jgi:ABC-type sugar transport system ATPase subunit